MSGTMFRKPRTTDDTSTMSDRSSNGNHEDILESSTDQSFIMPFSLPTPTPEPTIQHFIIHYLSYIEKECREKAANRLNAHRDPSHHLAEDHPDVLALGTKLYNEIVGTVITDQMKKTGLPLGDYAGPAGAQLRKDYSQKFSKALSNHAASNALDIDQDASGANSPLLPFTQMNMGRSGQDVLTGHSNNAPGDSSYAQHYREISMIGQGGYGKVYHVLNIVDNQHYAIKKVSISAERIRKLRNEGCLTTLTDEVRTLARLNHPNIVRYYGSWMSPRQRGMAQSLLEDGVQNNISYYTTDDDSIPGESRSVNELSDFAGSNQRSSEDVKIIFESSSAQESCSASERPNIRESSQGTTASRHASVRDAGDDDEEEEEEGREQSNVGNGAVDPKAKRILSQQTTLVEVPSVFPGEDIASEDWTLFIKMSLHPLTLSTYLSPDYNATSTSGVQHCFHTVPAAKICLGILDGIEYLHGQNIVHRDLKPANVLLTIDHKAPGYLSGFVDITGCPQCKGSETRRPIFIKPCVGDFGLVAKLDDPDQIGCRRLIKAEKEAHVGTKLYRPADMPTEEPSICPKLDIYSLGVIAFELVMKFDTESERRKVLSDLACGKYPDGFENHEMAEGIKNMLNGNRSQRWGASQVRSWLEELLIQKTAEMK